MSLNGTQYTFDPLTLSGLTLSNNLSGTYVPYTNATSDVTLNNKNISGINTLTATTINASSNASVGTTYPLYAYNVSTLVPTSAYIILDGANQTPFNVGDTITISGASIAAINRNYVVQQNYVGSQFLVINNAGLSGGNYYPTGGIVYLAGTGNISTVTASIGALTATSSSVTTEIVDTLTANSLLNIGSTLGINITPATSSVASILKYGIGGTIGNSSETLFIKNRSNVNSLYFAGDGTVKAIQNFNALQTLSIGAEIPVGNINITGAGSTFAILQYGVGGTAGTLSDRLVIRNRAGTDVVLYTDAGNVFQYTGIFSCPSLAITGITNAFVYNNGSGTATAVQAIFASGNTSSASPNIILSSSGTFQVSNTANTKNYFLVNNANNQILTNGIANIYTDSTYAVPNGRMAGGSLTIGSISQSYGAGIGWGSNTAGLLLETNNAQEIAVHHSGVAVYSMMAYDGTRLVIGREMGFGRPALTIACTSTLMTGAFTLNNTLTMNNTFTNSGSTISNGTFTVNNVMYNNNIQYLSNGDSSYTRYGPNSTWGCYLAVGAASSVVNTVLAQVITTNGNLHCDSAVSREMYLNYYSGGGVRIDNSEFRVTNKSCFGTQSNSSGIVNIRNPNGNYTHMGWVNNNNYIRGDGTQMDSDLYCNYQVYCAGGITINGTNSAYQTAVNCYYNNNSNGAWNYYGGTFGGGSGYWSLYATSRICGMEFWLKSDERIKTNIEPIINSLERLRLIKPVTYEYKDKFQYTNQPRHGLIAQQLEPILPCCVTTQDTVYYIPDIYELCSVVIHIGDGPIPPPPESIHPPKNPDELEPVEEQYPEGTVWEITLSKPPTFQAPIKLKTYLEKGVTEHIIDIIRIEGNVITTTTPIKQDKIFIYGTPITDFKTVNYQDIGILTLKSVQELDEIVQQQQLLIEQQQKQIEEQKAQIASYENRFKHYDELLDSMDQKFKRLGLKIQF